jgi:hypothetical protein
MTQPMFFGTPALENCGTYGGCGSYGAPPPPLALANDGYGGITYNNPQDPVPYLRSLVTKKAHELAHAKQQGNVTKIKYLQGELNHLKEKLAKAMGVSKAYYDATGESYGSLDYGASAGAASTLALSTLEQRLKNLKHRRKKAKTSTSRKLIDAQIKGVKKRIKALKKRITKQVAGDTAAQKAGRWLTGKQKATVAKSKSTTTKGTAKSHQIRVLRAAHAKMQAAYEKCHSEGYKRQKCKRILKEIRKTEGRLKKLGVAVKYSPPKTYTSSSSSSAPAISMVQAGVVSPASVELTAGAYPGDESYDYSTDSYSTDTDDGSYTTGSYSTDAYDTSSWSTASGGGMSVGSDYSPSTTEDVEEAYDEEIEEDSNLLTYALLGGGVLALGGGGYWWWRRRKAIQGLE